MYQEALTVIQTASITLPALEVSVLLALLSFCLVLRLIRIGLITAYLFIYRWGWMLFATKDEKFLTTYLIFGTAIGIITAAGLIFSHHSTED